MSRIGIHQFDRPEVELPGGLVYSILPATKSVSAKADGLEADIEAAVSSEAIVALYGKLLDLRLRPVEDKQQKASTAIKRAYDRDELTLQQLTRLVLDIGETDRPF